MKNLANEIIGTALLMMTILSFVMILSTSCKAATGSSLEQMNTDYSVCVDEVELQYEGETELIKELTLECEEENLM